MVGMAEFISIFMTCSKAKLQLVCAVAAAQAYLPAPLIPDNDSNCLFRQQWWPAADSISAVALLAAVADYDSTCICCSLLVGLLVLLQQHLQELVPVVQLLQGSSNASAMHSSTAAVAIAVYMSMPRHSWRNLQNSVHSWTGELHMYIPQAALLQLL